MSKFLSISTILVFSIGLFSFSSVNADQDAKDLLNTGEVPRDKSLNPTEHAAWTQVAATVLASDLALMLF